MTAEEVLQAMTGLVNQNINLTTRLAQIQAQLDAVKASQKEPVIGEAEEVHTGSD